MDTIIQTNYGRSLPNIAIIIYAILLILLSGCVIDTPTDYHCFHIVPITPPYSLIGILNQSNCKIVYIDKFGNIWIKTSNFYINPVILPVVTGWAELIPETH